MIGSPESEIGVSACTLYAVVVGFVVYWVLAKTGLRPAVIQEHA